MLNLGNPPPGAAAYTDSEVQGAKPGSFYYNINGNTLHMCSIIGFPPCTWLSISGGGSVTSFSAGSLSPLFTISVTNPTTTPALSFVLSNAAANTVFGRCAGTTGAPSFCTLTTAQLGNAPVTSVFGRTGAVVSATNDYSFSQISGTLLGSQFGPLTGDVTTSAYAATLANSGVTAGSCGSATTSCALAIDAKGRITSKTDTAVDTGILAFCNNTITNATDLTGSAVTIATCAVTTPSSGCPCRAQFSYSTSIVKISAGDGVSEWVSSNVADSLTNTVFASSSAGESNASNGGTAEVGTSAWSFGTFSNSTMITFTLKAQNLNGHYTLNSTPQVGTGPSMSFQVAMVPSI